MLVECLILTFLISNGESARILGAVFTPSYSHQITYWPIWRELSQRGHEVVVLTTDPMHDPSLTNLTEIDLNSSYDVLKSHNVSSLLSSSKFSPVKRAALYLAALSATADHQLSHPDVRNLIQNASEHFDLLLVEVAYPTQMAFAARFHVPFIGLMSYDAQTRIHLVLGNPINPVLYPDPFQPFAMNLSFKERVLNTLLFLGYWWHGRFVLYPGEDLIVRKHFGESMPKLHDIEKNISLLFINTNPAFNVPRPLGPNTISINGGLHLRKPQPLPKDLQEYLDSSTNGFIYFNLGTNAKSSEINEDTKNGMLEVFKELPYNILWKYETDEINTDVNKNIKTYKWIPQQDVLRHPNIKLFITQCGLQSVEEAIASEVTMVGLPFHGDQLQNCRIIENKELGLWLSPYSFKKAAFSEAIKEVISNPKYRKNMVETAKLYNDFEKSGLERAIWWTEYVIRHKGARHLRNPIVDMPLYQQFLLDVIAFLAAIVFIGIYVPVKILKIVVRLFVFKFWRKPKTE